MTHEEFNEGFRNRTKAFAVRVLKLSERLPQNPGTRVVVFQICKSATSTGANFRAFCRGSSQNEKFAKICIVVEEIDETVYWLEIIEDAKYDESPELAALLQEGIEILKVCAKIKTNIHP